ncbi:MULTISPECIES: LysR substrate-binding domain-containing protein [unclassified Halomonas]|uniref:LysR substrate-binding domain-containing protein n=1 Tax=unclassified Halomonas TaxID=2609666 RepID=UPI0021E3F4E3|nr:MULTISPECIES: LysR substrate-binding domain-containing protein [unclassified Halomonas]UYG00720.1 LysR substrate-binding domain-containing protein [Halomonas sp. GD1P12]WNL38224.1 LysR substrate-binding domain-containing protein [Halomonas sp. PAMB 3232]WNL41524.1 LysR substrate-binding domain-containing protein [Halomonas sp. PAMB 3264]
MRAPIFDLSLLRTLVAIADTGSVTAAAKRLSYTQSTVSMQLNRLEAQLDLTLHEREGRRLRFTPEGERLLAHARRLLAQNDEAFSDMKARQVTGDLTLGIPEDYASLLPSVFAYFHQLYPAVGLTVICGTSAHLVEQVKNADIDLALVTRQRNSPGGEVIRREPLLWAVGMNQQPLLSDPIPLALYSPGADVFREVAEQALQAAGRDWRVAYTSQSMAGLAPIVTAGLAVVVITRSMLTPSLRPLDEASGLPALPMIELALHRAPHRPTEPAKRLGELIREQLAAIGEAL